MAVSLRPLLVHLLLAASASTGFVLYPPAEGAVLLVPLTGDDGVAIRTAVAAGATLVGIGPWRGSVVMQGKRTLLAAPLARAGVLMLAAPPGGCGAGQPGQTV